MDSSRERRIRLIGEIQHGMVTRGQLLALGMTDRMVEFRLRAGLWDRVVPGVYGLPGRVKDRRSSLAAATLALPGAVVSHESAGIVHQLPGVPHVAAVTVAYRTTHSFPGVVVHQSTDLTPADIVTHDRLRVTSLSRTILDLARVLRRERLERVVDHCLTARRVDIAVLRTQLDSVARRGKPGIRLLRAVLDERGPGYVAPESELERLAMEVLTTGGLPEPERQVTLLWGSSEPHRVDFAYPEARLVIEVDGRRWHTRDLDFERDRRRDNLATLAGWRVLRFTWGQLQEEPARVCWAVRQALGK
ncbi:MAG: DUF559 domain-containing protein [Acidimicrobiia bacterium]